MINVFNYRLGGVVCGNLFPVLLVTLHDVKAGIDKSGLFGKWHGCDPDVDI